MQCLIPTSRLTPRNFNPLSSVLSQNNFIISGSSDWNIKIWSAFTGKCLKTLTGHENLVRALAFDAKRGVLVSASYDKSVRVWDLRDILEGGANRTQDGDRERERDSKSLMRVFRNAHTSHIFDVKFDVGRIVRYVFPLFQVPLFTVFFCLLLGTRYSLIRSQYIP